MGDEVGLFGDALVETVIVNPVAGMPREQFLHFEQLATIIEQMDRAKDGRVIWDPERVIEWSPQISEAIYGAWRRGWIEVYWEVPRSSIEVEAADT